MAIRHYQDGRLHAAGQICRQVLQVDADQADAIHLLGVIAHHSGRPDEALACYRRAVQLKPDFAEAHYNQGNALKLQGKLDEALACYRRAVQLKPDFAPAHYNLGVALKEQGRPDEAVACWRKAVELKPDHAAAYCNLGLVLKEQNKLDDAAACYRRAVELKPDLAEAHAGLGLIFKEQGKLDGAAACWRRSVELKPDFAEAHGNLGSVLKEQGKLYDAVACFRRAVALKPDFAEAHHNLGTVLQDLGNLEEAVDCYRQAAAGYQGIVSTRPQFAEAQSGLGKSFSQLAFILGGRLPEDDLLTMRQLLSDANVGGDGRIALEFGLARVLDAQGKHAEAAEHLRQANALRAAHLEARNQAYDPAAYRSFVDGMIAATTPNWFARCGGFGLETELPVFIFGLPRSGTTLVEQIAASHSQVFGAGELPDGEETFEYLPKAMSREAPPLECLPDLDRAAARLLAQRHVDRLQVRAGGTSRIVDKMPDNYHFLGLLGVLFPRARFIHCRRDLRDVALSCWMTDFGAVSWACRQEHIASRFAGYRRLMEHWREVLPLPILDVDYEEMVEDLEGAARRIVSWCGLAWEPRCLEFYETRRTVQTASAVQVRQPIYKTSVGRWKNYQESMHELFTSVLPVPSPSGRGLG
jgi:tetratricopeptide (TPR) repeat protein